MISLRSLLFIILAVCFSISWAGMSTAALSYNYDVAENSVIAQNNESGALNYQYDSALNLQYCCSGSLSSDSQEKNRVGSFFALVGDIVATKGASKAASKSDDVIHVTKDGVALPPGPKHKIPDNYVQNPHRSSSYGEVVNGKFKERLRIDPPTPPGQKGPNYSHYHKNGKGTHYSPRPGDKDPEF